MSGVTPTVSAAVERWRAGFVDFNAISTTWKESDASGKRIIVTGGASGIGEACARRLADLGAHVVIADLDDSAGLELQEELIQRGKR